MTDIGGQLYKVTDNVVITYRTELSAIKSTLYVLNRAIIFSTDYSGYNLKIVRTSSKAGGTVGEINSYSGILNGVQFVGYDVLIRDTLTITIELENATTGQLETPDCAIELRPVSSSDDGKIEIRNGGSFVTANTTYYISANIS